MTEVAVGIVEFEGKVLIGKKFEEGSDLHGQWHFPGGIVDEGEDLQATMIREMKEETGLSVKIVRAMGSNPIRKVRLNWFLCSTEDVTNLEAHDDLSDVKFVTKKEALEMFRERAENEWPEDILKYLQS